MRSPSALAPKSGEDDGMNRADAHRRQHENDGFGTGGHVDGEAISLVDAHAAQGRGYALDFVQQMRVGVDLPLAPFVQVNEGSVSAMAALHVIVERVIRHVGLRPDVPLEGWRRPFQHALPLAKPGQLLGSAPPESFRVLVGFVDPALHHRADEIVRDGVGRMLVRARSSSRLGCGIHDDDTPFKQLRRTLWVRRGKTITHASDALPGTRR